MAQANSALFDQVKTTFKGLFGPVRFEKLWHSTKKGIGIGPSGTFDPYLVISILYIQVVVSDS